jgi:hypothetical protein
MPERRKVAKLEESIKVYEEVIRSFQVARDRMQQRRHGASDMVTVHIDESLSLNQRTLDSLSRVLATAHEQLQEARSRLNGA